MSPWTSKLQKITRDSFLKPGEPWPCQAGSDGLCRPVGQPEDLTILSPWRPLRHTSDQPSFWVGLAGFS